MEFFGNQARALFVSHRAKKFVVDIVIEHSGISMTKGFLVAGLLGAGSCLMMH